MNQLKICCGELKICSRLHVRQDSNTVYLIPKPYLSCFFFFWPHEVACGIKSMPPALGPRSLNYWTTREVPSLCYNFREECPQQLRECNMWQAALSKKGYNKCLPHHKILQDPLWHFPHWDKGTVVLSWDWGGLVRLQKWHYRASNVRSWNLEELILWLLKCSHLEPSHHAVRKLKPPMQRDHTEKAWKYLEKEECLLCSSRCNSNVPAPATTWLPSLQSHDWTRWDLPKGFKMLICWEDVLYNHSN